MFRVCVNVNTYILIFAFFTLGLSTRGRPFLPWTFDARPPLSDKFWIVDEKKENVQYRQKARTPPVFGVTGGDQLFVPAFFFLALPDAFFSASHSLSPVYCTTPSSLCKPRKSIIEVSWQLRYRTLLYFAFRSNSIPFTNNYIENETEKERKVGAESIRIRKKKKKVKQIEFSFHTSREIKWELIHENFNQSRGDSLGNRLQRNRGIYSRVDWERKAAHQETPTRSPSIFNVLLNSAKSRNRPSLFFKITTTKICLSNDQNNEFFPYPQSWATILTKSLCTRLFSLLYSQPPTYLVHNLTNYGDNLATN